MNRSSRPEQIGVPEDLERKWQGVVDILARVSGFVAALIMRVEPPEIEVFIRNDHPDNPFARGARTPLDTDLFCERAMLTRSLVHCRDALKDPVWLNPVVTVHGFACYYGMPLFWPDGRPFGTICILNRRETDVTHEAAELVRLLHGAVEDDLRNLFVTARELDASRAEQLDVQSKYASMFHQAAVGMARVGLDGRWLEVNDKLCNIVGHSRRELMSMKFQDLTVDEDPAKDQKILEKLIAGQVPFYSTDKRYLHRTGARVWAQVMVSLVRTTDGAPDYLILVVQDITEKKALQHDLEHAQKLETLGRLVGGIAHEFNNKLATISGKLFLAGRNDVRRFDLIEQAEKECHEAAEMIKGLLAYTRNDQITRRPLAMNVYLNEVVGRLRPIMPEHIDFEVVIDDGPMTANVDPTQIQQIALNLINNAIDAVETATNPRIVLRLTAVPMSNELRSKLPGVEASALARLDVEDNGIGIASSELSKIFDPFYTTKPVNKGTGLGLGIVAGLARQHDGVIDVESARGSGSRFSVFLPLSDAAELAPTATASDEPKVAPGKTILVVDDNEGVLETTSDILEHLGYRVLKAHDGQDALSTYLRTDRIDCLLTDVAMPKMGGVELCEKLRAHDPNVKLIFMTGYNDRISAEAAHCPRLFKPIDIHDLRRTLIEMTGP